MNRINTVQECDATEAK